MLKALLIAILIVLQLVILIKGIVKVHNYIFDICGYVDIMFSVFFALPAWDYYFESNNFSHIAENYSLHPAKEVVLKYIVITTLIAFLFDIGYSLGKKMIRNTGNIKQALVNLNDEDTLIHDHTYKIVCFGLFLVWGYIIFSEYRTYGGSLISFLLPARKQGIKSGLFELLQYMIPETLFTLAVIKNWNNKKIIRPVLFSLLIVAISASISAQRRDMLQAIIYCGLLLFIKYVRGKTKKSKEKGRERKVHWTRYIIIGLGVTILAIPFLWYFRNFSSQYSRGDEIVNPFSLHSFTDLIFGSSSSGFDSTIVIDWYDETYGNLFLHCIKFVIGFWIPRSLYPNKISQITMLIKEARGDWGNISLFYVNDLYFSFKEISVVVVPIIGALIAKLYYSTLKDHNIVKSIMGLYMFSQIILLFKNGISVFFIYIIAYYVIFTFSIKLCLKISVGDKKSDDYYHVLIKM